MDTSSPSPLERPGSRVQDIGSHLEAAALTTILIAALVVFARLYPRTRVAKSLGWDDGLMLLALALGVASTATEVVAVRNGFGRHLEFVSLTSLAVIGKYLALSGALCNLALMFAKLSIIVTLLRVLRGSGEKFWIYFFWGLALTILEVNTAVTGTQFGQCMPSSKLWDREKPGHCWNPRTQRDLSYVQGAYSAFTDFALSGCPLIVFRHLNMSKKSRNALIVVMSLGLITGALAIARTVETWRYSGINDSTWTSVTLLLLAALERNLAIILASVPQCRSLLRKKWTFTTIHSMVSRISRSTDETSRSGSGAVFSAQDTSDMAEKGNLNIKTARQDV